MRLRGHLQTVLPTLRHALRPLALAPSEPWSTMVDDAKLGPVRLSGALQPGEGDAVLVVVHGLGGASDSPYVRSAASTAARANLACLRVDLRGADLRGEDFYHAGLAADLRAIAASSALAAYRRVLFLGFSLGGHVALRFAAEGAAPRVAAVAAVCPPLDLARGADAIDHPLRRPYLRHVLSGLVASYAAVARRREVPLPIARAREIRSIRAWDDLVVAPRHGFRDASDYYARMSAGPLLHRIEVPTLVVHGADDPMVPAWTHHPWVERRSRAVDYRSVDGGHCGFPADLDLGERAPRGLDAQLVAWLARHAA